MNTTIVWVLMVFSSGGTQPTLEFTTEMKCLAAAERIDKARAERSWKPGGYTSWCMRIEK